MHLVQILLPVYDDNGEEILRSAYPDIRDELVASFGGLTAFIEAPAEGLWTGGGKQTGRDDIVMLEVMVANLERAWWASYRKRLEERLRQESIVIRALPMESL